MEKVLIADEKGEITEVCTKLLNYYGYEVIPANSVVEAVGEIRPNETEKNRIGVFVVSYNLPLKKGEKTGLVDELINQASCGVPLDLGEKKNKGNKLVKFIRDYYSNNSTQPTRIIGLGYYPIDKRAGLDKIVDNKVDFVNNIAEIVGKAI